MTADFKNVADQVALITGGAQGIGHGTAAFLLERGMRVVICDKDSVAGNACLQQLGQNGRLHFVHADIASEKDVEEVVSEAARWGGRLDALVNNAGISDPETGPIEDLDLAAWQQRLDVNLTGPFLMTKHAVPHLRKSNGSVVNIASTRALQSEPHTEAYAAAKGGLVALTHALAVSLRPDIRVNCISPGWIDVRAFKADAPEVVPPLSRSEHQQHPAGRVGTPEDVAAMVAFLISEQAGFTTGQNIVVDGGMSRKMIYEA